MPYCIFIDRSVAVERLSLLEIGDEPLPDIHNELLLHTTKKTLTQVVNRVHEYNKLAIADLLESSDEQNIYNVTYHFNNCNTCPILCPSPYRTR